jgi:hypothetical protein
MQKAAFGTRVNWLEAALILQRYTSK